MELVPIDVGWVRDVGHRVKVLTSDRFDLGSHQTNIHAGETEFTARRCVQKGSLCSGHRTADTFYRKESVSTLPTLPGRLLPPTALPSAVMVIDECADEGFDWISVTIVDPIGASVR